MNTWKQIYASATREEREEITLLLLERIQERKRLFPRLAHYVNRPRSARSQSRHLVAASLIGMTIILTLSLIGASWHPASLLMVPLFGIYLLIYLAVRNLPFELTTGKQKTA